MSGAEIATDPISTSAVSMREAALAFDLKKLDPRFLDDPYPLYRALREHDPERGRIDLIGDVAAAIPVQLIGDMLGVPSNERGPLRGWSLAILGALEPVLGREQFERGVNAVAQFKAYLVDLVRRRLRE